MNFLSWVGLLFLSVMIGTLVAAIVLTVVEEIIFRKSQRKSVLVVTTGHEYLDWLEKTYNWEEERA